VLAQLDELDGVESSAVNESGSLIRVTLQPDADPARVAAEAERVLRAAGQRVGVAVGGPSSPGKRGAATALSQETWRDHNQVARQAAAERRAELRGWLLLLLLLFANILLAFLCWREYRRRRLASLTVPCSGG
jgi:hypothetical protein